MKQVRKDWLRLSSGKQEDGDVPYSKQTKRCAAIAMSRMEWGPSKLDDTARMRLTLGAVALLISFLFVFKIPDSSMIMTSWPIRFLQFEISSHDIATLAYQYRELMLQYLPTQLLSKSEWPSFGVKVRAAFRCRLKYALIASSLDVSVIVPTLNEEKYLPKCLESLVRQPREEEFEVIVVDGGSTDRTVEIARKFADKVLVKPMAPVGAARNLGAKEAKGEILAFIDADTVSSDHWIQQIVDAFDGNQAAIGVTGPTYPYGGTQLDDLLYHIATGWVQRLSLKLGFPHVAGFNCAYRKSAFWNAGGFDEGRELSEDVMLSLRIRHEGRVLFDPEMVAYTSLRRIEKVGYPYLTAYYVINAAALMLFHRNLPYPKVR
jgi:hypothetical protein